MLEIKTVNKGAELVSLKLNGKEKIHNGKEYWYRHSPILFPIVGKVKDNKYIIDNKEYNLKQHGFARDTEFECISDNNYVLKSNKDTLKIYPYKFLLKVSYEVIDNSLITKYKVKNIDDKVIYFGLGGHPAFKCNYENTYIKFNKEEDKYKTYKLDNGLISTNKDISRYIDKDTFKIDKNTFDEDAIIFENLNSDTISLYENNKKILDMEFKEFKYLAIWTKPNSNFLCIEPWMNTADNINSNYIFKDKKDIISLNIDEEFSVQYKINFYE